MHPRSRSGWARCTKLFGNLPEHDNFDSTTSAQKQPRLGGSPPVPAGHVVFGMKGQFVDCTETIPMACPRTSNSSPRGSCSDQATCQNISYDSLLINFYPCTKRGAGALVVRETPPSSPSSPPPPTVRSIYFDLHQQLTLVRTLSGLQGGPGLERSRSNLAAINGDRER